MEPEITPNAPVEKEAPKASKFTIILIVLIGVSAGFLGYLVYKSNAETTKTNTSSTDSATVANPIPSTPTTVPGSSTTPTTSTRDAIPAGGTYTTAQVAAKNSKSACWTIISGNVYDITAYVPNHPGGEEQILKVCGRDGTALFAKPMAHQEGGASDVLAGFKIGTLAK